MLSAWVWKVVVAVSLPNPTDLEHIKSFFFFRQILILFSVELKFELFIPVTKLDKMLWLRKISLAPWVCSGFRPADPSHNPTKRIRMVSQMAFRPLESLHGHLRILSLSRHEDRSSSYDNSAFIGFSSGSCLHVGSWTCVWMDTITCPWCNWQIPFKMSLELHL